jgi:enoyl-CoA hydratase
MDNDVILERAGAYARIGLNRPKALHALTLDMCRRITEALLSWNSDPEVRAIVLDHHEGRGFCAGGDIRQLFEWLKAGAAQARDFFLTEYRLDHLLFTLKAPSLCFMDGIVMGGGAGLAMPCRYRVATEATAFAMPETGIGIFPDVGGSRFLSHLPDRVGPWLALTGTRLDGADCLALGLATHYLPRDALADVKARIRARPEELETILRTAQITPPPANTDRQRADIRRLFAADKLEDIVAALKADPSPWATAQAEAIAGKSPRSGKVALRQLREGRGFTDFADNMRMEYRIAMRLIARPDFVEGVRAFVIDKDNKPRWSPASMEDVSDAEIDAIFAPLPPHEEWTPLETGQ